MGGNISKSGRVRRLRLGGYSLGASLIVAALAVIVVLAVGTLPSRYTAYDMSSEGFFSLSPQTEELVGALEEDVEVYLLAVSGSEDETIMGLLERYEDLSAHVKVSVVDPVADPAFARQYTDELQYTNSLLVLSGERSRFVDYTEIYTTDYSAYYQSYDESDINYQFNGESVLTSAIHYVTGTELPQLYCLSGHGEAPLDSAFARAVAADNVHTQTLSLATAGGIPEDCDCLLIFAPTVDLTEGEVAQVEEYLAAGGRLLLVSTYLGEALPRLEGLMARYGCTLAPGLVLEQDSDHYAYGYPDCLLPRLGSHEITAPLAQAGLYVAAPGAQGIVVQQELPEDCQVSVLLESTEQAYAITDTGRAEPRPGDAQGPFALGVAVEAGESSIVWFSSAYLFNESYSSAFGGAGEDLFLNALNWLCQREESITIHARSLSTEMLTLTTRQMRTLGVLVCMVVPLGFVAAAVVARLRRRRLR